MTETVTYERHLRLSALCTLLGIPRTDDAEKTMRVCLDAVAERASEESTLIDEQIDEGYFRDCSDREWDIELR